MKTYTLVPVFLIGLFISGWFINLFRDDQALYQPRKEQFGLPPTGFEAAYKRYERLLRNVNTGKVEVSSILEARENTFQFIKKQHAVKDLKSLGLQWEEMGPDNVGGRTRGLLVDKNNHQRMFAGTGSGGLWYSNNGGISWKQWEPAGDLAWLGVSCIVQAPNGDIYVGTGEGFNYMSATISGNSMFVGNGIWKSTDGGLNFSQIKSTIPPLAVDTEVVPTVLSGGNLAVGIYRSIVTAVDVNSGYETKRYRESLKVGTLNSKLKFTMPNIAGYKYNLYVTVTNGKVETETLQSSSNNPGAVIEITEVNPNTAELYALGWETVQRVAVDPGNSSKIYCATTKGIRQSYDGGNTWKYPVREPEGPGNKDFSYDIKVTSEGLVVASVGATPYLSPDGDTAHAFNSITDNGGGYAQLNFAFSHKFTAGQRIYVCGTGVPVANKGRQIVSSVPSSTAVILASSFSSDITGTGTPYASSWFPLSPATVTVYDTTLSMTDTLINDAIYDMPISGAGRIEWSVCSSNPAYLACAISDGNIASVSFGEVKYVMQSKDRGKTWADLGINLNIGDQGGYDNAIGAYPDDCNKVIVGWVWMADNNYGAWDYHSINYDPTGDGMLYVHADKHAVVFHPDYLTSLDKKIFYGTDGGLYTSKIVNGFRVFNNLNNNYATVQFYGLAIGPYGEVFGGTQDNGNPFIDPNNFTNGEPTIHSMDYNLPSGDGGYGEISVINKDAFIWESQNALVSRSPDRPDPGQGAPDGSDGVCYTNPNDPEEIMKGHGIFINPFTLWESFNDTSSTEYVTYITDSFETYQPGDTILVPSKNNKTLFIYVTDTAVNGLDTLSVKDIVQAKFAIIINNGVWLTKDILDFSISPFYKKISIVAASYEAQLAFTPDGNKLFVSSGSSLYRIDNLNLYTSPAGIQTSCYSSTIPPGIITSPPKTFSATVTHISVDPDDANNVVVSLGEYGKTDHVYRSTNALTAMTFTSIQTDLPAMPVYSVLIEKHDKNRVLAGTEYGIFTTDNAFATNINDIRWTEENNGMSMAPVYQIRQQVHTNAWPDAVTNEGVIYIATHGRGIFKCTTFADDPQNINEQKPVVYNINVNIYPNPVREYGTAAFRLMEQGKVAMNIFDIHGNLVKAVGEKNYSAGNVVLKFEACRLAAGTYIVIVNVNGRKSAGRFVVMK